jgi:protein SCO1/2
MRSLLRAALLSALVVGCRKADIVSEVHPDEGTRANVVDVEAGPSIYALAMNLVDQDGQAIGLDAWRGHPVLIGMFYATCPNACPMFVSTILGVERSLDDATRADLRVLLVSFDPSDKPDALSRLANKHKIDKTRWRLATGSEDQVRDLAAVLGVKYRRLPDGNYNHSSPLVLLGRDGAMHVRVESIGDPTDGLADRLRVLTRER